MSQNTTDTEIDDKLETDVTVCFAGTTKPAVYWPVKVIGFTPRYLPLPKGRYVFHGHGCSPFREGLLWTVDDVDVESVVTLTHDGVTVGARQPDGSVL